MPAFPIRKLLLGLGVASVLLIGAEALVRAYEASLERPSLLEMGEGAPGTLVPDLARGWVQLPGGYAIDPIRSAWAQQHGRRAPHDGAPMINSRGMRDHEPAMPPPPGQLRVLALGDSSVWGSGVDFGLSFSRRLEHALDPDGPDTPDGRAVDVFNAGVPGYSSFQVLETLRGNLDLGLHGLIVYSMVSDMQHTEGGTDDDYYASWTWQGQGALGQLATYRLLRGLLRPTPVAHAPEQAVRQRSSLAGYRRNLEEMAAIARREGLPLVFVMPPLRPDLSPRREPRELQYRIESDEDAARIEARLAATEERGGLHVHGPYRRTMALVAWQQGVPMIDGPGLFRAAIADEPDAYKGFDSLFVDDVHPSHTGHALLADALLPYLQEWRAGQ